jgi:GNAT superfamily N-acetyltransferase
MSPDMSADSAQVKLAQTDAEIRACFAVMHQLRTHLVESEFVAQVRRQEQGGFRLVCVIAEGEVRAVSGYRLMENLYSGKFLYVDDLVTGEHQRSQGWGGLLFDWLVAQARANACATLELDSGVQRFGAHRFYLRRRMDIVSHHFRLELRR